MSSLKKRSYQKELLDGDDIPFEAIKRNMQELYFINERLGGHSITVSGVSQLLKNANDNKPLYIVEIGCGGGDNLRVIKRWAENRGLAVSLKGIDINAKCISFAENLEANKGIQFLCSDYKDVDLSVVPDIIFSALFCHHFTDEELVKMLQWMQINSRIGFFINDLHRHLIAYYAIKLLTQVFSKSYLVKNDAPLSVRRGFTENEWTHLFLAAGISNFSCQWKWAFRWLIIYQHAAAKTI